MIGYKQNKDFCNIAIFISLFISLVSIVVLLVGAVYCTATDSENVYWSVPTLVVLLLSLYLVGFFRDLKRALIPVRSVRSQSCDTELQPSQRRVIMRK